MTKWWGFMSGMINENHLDAHFVGIDYELNKTIRNISKGCFYDYIKTAIDHKN